MRILIDTNIILDIIQKREPFFADVQGVDIHTAPMRSMPDFEDAVVDAVAERNGCHYLIAGQAKQPVPGIDPSYPIILCFWVIIKR